jgi:hypothetical protein
LRRRADRGHGWIEACAKCSLGRPGIPRNERPQSGPANGLRQSAPLQLIALGSHAMRQPAPSRPTGRRHHRPPNGCGHRQAWSQPGALRISGSSTASRHPLSTRAGSKYLPAPPAWEISGAAGRCSPAPRLPPRRTRTDLSGGLESRATPSRNSPRSVGSSQSCGPPPTGLPKETRLERAGGRRAGPGGDRPLGTSGGVRSAVAPAWAQRPGPHFSNRFCARLVTALACCCRGGGPLIRHALPALGPPSAWRPDSGDSSRR